MGIVLLANLVLIGAELTDISKNLGFGDNTITTFNPDGISYEKTADGAVIIFKGGEVSIKGNLFEDIKSQDDAKLPSEIKIDKDGKITSAEFTVNELGGSYVFGNTQIYAPPNSRVLFDKESGIQMKVQDNSQFADIPKQKDSSIPSEYLTTIEGNNYNLPNGAFITGRLGFDKNGQAFVEADNKVAVDNVEIIDEDHFGQGSRTKVFFDGEKHEGKYVSFGKDNLIIASNKEDTLTNPIVNFKQGNKFIKVDEGDYVAMNSFSGGEIEIQNRDSQGMIPRILTKGSFFIDEDYKSILYKNEEIYLQKFSISNNNKQTSTSPIELVLLDRTNQNIFKSGDKLFVDNFNRIALGLDMGEFSASSEGIDTKFSSRIRYNYPSEESIRALIGKELIFNDVSHGGKDVIYGRLRDYWETLTSETKNSIKYLEFSSNDYFESGVYPWKSPNVNAFAKPDGGIVFRSGISRLPLVSDHSFDLDSFRHESAHELHMKLNREYTEKNFLSSLFYSSFQDEWIETSGENVYGFSGEISKILENKAAEYRGEPLEGVISPYVATNEPLQSAVFEDVATFVQSVAVEPFIFGKLINPSNPDYDPRYRQKLDILHKYKFISDFEYNKILEVAGVK